MSYRLRQIAAIVRYLPRQWRLARQGKAFPLAQLHNLAWFDSPQKKLPTVSLEQLFPGISSVQAELVHALPKLRGNLTVDELCAASMICRYLQPRTIFEFGTFNGRTTVNLALNSPPDARICTLDLPQPGQTQFQTDKRDDGYQLGSEAGKLYRESPLAHRVEQIWCDSAKFDATPFHGSVDLVFIDASHTYEYVRNDSGKALAMLRPGGVILWHDYCVWYGVAQRLHELRADYPICHIEGTHLAALRT